MKTFAAAERRLGTREGAGRSSNCNSLDRKRGNIFGAFQIFTDTHIGCTTSGTDWRGTAGGVQEDLEASGGNGWRNDCGLPLVLRVSLAPPAKGKARTVGWGSHIFSSFFSKYTERFCSKPSILIQEKMLNIPTRRCA